VYWRQRTAALRQLGCAGLLDGSIHSNWWCGTLWGDSLGVGGGHSITIKNFAWEWKPQSPPPTPPPPAAPPCTYTLMNNALPWAGADADCQAAGLQLATVQSAAQNAQLLAVAAGNHVWMGGTDAASEGTWVWSPSNTPLSYTNWYPGEPNDHHGVEDCLWMIGGNGKWNDSPCTGSWKYVCQTACPPPVASTGPCKASGNCACSSNYDASCTSPSGTYNNNEECTVTFPPSSVLTSYAFSTERGYDKVTVNGVQYSGSTGPNGVVASSMTWSSDHSVVSQGWKICAN
jgi:hypothetical protein